MLLVMQNWLLTFRFILAEIGNHCRGTTTNHTTIMGSDSVHLDHVKDANTVFQTQSFSPALMHFYTKANKYQI